MTGDRAEKLHGIACLMNKFLKKLDIGYTLIDAGDKALRRLGPILYILMRHPDYPDEVRLDPIRLSDVWPVSPIDLSIALSMKGYKEPEQDIPVSEDIKKLARELNELDEEVLMYMGEIVSAIDRPGFIRGEYSPCSVLRDLQLPWGWRKLHHIVDALDKLIEFRERYGLTIPTRLFTRK